MKTLLTALPMLAFYLTLVCGRRLGPTDTTLFVVNSTMQIILFAFMIRALLKWRRVRDIKRFAVALTSVIVACTAAYHPSTSPRTYFIQGLSNWKQSDTAAITGVKDTRPTITGSDEEVQELEDKINSGRIYQQPVADKSESRSLSRARLDTLPLVYHSNATR